MPNNINTSVERIIAKIDNDFNPDNSDWIPRVGAWTIDAMNTLKVLRTQPKRVKLEVHDRIAYAPCSLDASNLIVNDSKGCSISKAKRARVCGSSSSTGKMLQSIEKTPDTVDIVYNDDPDYVPDLTIAETVQTKDYPSRYNVKEINYNKQFPRDYVLIDNNKIELNYDTDCIYIEYPAVATTYSDTYNCDIPIIPNNGLLLEAITYYCMYKMLCRGYKHPVFNLAASQYGTNPYYEWNKLQDQAKRSVIIDKQGNVINDGGLFRSSLYVATFNPRRS